MCRCNIWLYIFIILVFECLPIACLWFIQIFTYIDHRLNGIYESLNMNAWLGANIERVQY